MPTFVPSIEKAAFGGLALENVEVVQGLCDPLAELVQPAGNAGADTESKFCAKTLDCPSANAKFTVPRFSAPSCSCKVAMLVPPHVPVAVSENAFATAAPPAK